MRNVIIRWKVRIRGKVIIRGKVRIRDKTCVIVFFIHVVSCNTDRRSACFPCKLTNYQDGNFLIYYSMVEVHVMFNYMICKPQTARYWQNKWIIWFSTEK